jgi:hypothetical protein
MPDFKFVIGLVAVTVVVIRAIFSKGDDKHDYCPGPDSLSCSCDSNSGWTWPSHHPPPSSYSRAHTGRTLATSGNDNHSSRISPHAGESRQETLASARSLASHQLPPSYVRGTLSTTDYDRKDRSAFDSLRTGESRQTYSTAARTRIAHQPPSAPSRIRSQAIAKVPATTNNRSLRGSSRTPPPPAVEPRSTALAQALNKLSKRPPSSGFGIYQSLTRSHPRPSSPSDLVAHIALHRKERTSVALPSPTLDSRFHLKSEELENVQDINIAKELRGRAQRHHREMRHARTLAKSAHKRRDYQTKRAFDQHAIIHESARELLNARAATIIFRENNKVCK